MSTASGAQPQVARERVSPEGTEQTEAPTVAAESAPVATGEAVAVSPAASAPAGTVEAAAASTPASAPAATGEPVATAGTGDGSAQQSAPHRTTRRVRLSMARVDPWSVLKVSFLLSVAGGIAMVIATGVLWLVLSGLNVFSDLDRVIRDIQPVTSEPFSIMDYIGFARVVSLSVVIAVIDVILLTALSTLGAYLYNICSSLVGGVRMTLTDD